MALTGVEERQQESGIVSCCHSEDTSWSSNTQTEQVLRKGISCSPDLILTSEPDPKRDGHAFRMFNRMFSLNNF